ncbi:uncharacterized protein ACNLHF_002197 [Anomaloglossus baeobatrachus]|uniref:uncharacterized protein LOC142257225 n=1 Tax=Anomaloglossus baeobatrachus TaxID=238106 RepID=UPI003F4FF557
MAIAELLLPVILSTLVATTFSLSCNECSGLAPKSCQRTKVMCPPDFNVCVATLESDTQHGKQEITLYREYCGKSSMCSYTGSLTTNFAGKKMSSTCCFTSNCSPSMPKFPTEKNDKNGVSCKSCSNLKEATCETSTTIDCIGDEKECVTMAITSKAGDASSIYFLSGCGTQGLCNVTEREYQYGGQATKTTFMCSGGNDIHPVGLPLMLLVILFCLKVLS